MVLSTIQLIKSETGKNLVLTGFSSLIGAGFVSIKIISNSFLSLGAVDDPYNVSLSKELYWSIRDPRFKDFMVNYMEANNYFALHFMHIGSEYLMSPFNDIREQQSLLDENSKYIKEAIRKGKSDGYIIIL